MANPVYLCLGQYFVINYHFYNEFSIFIIDMTVKLHPTKDYQCSQYNKNDINGKIVQYAICHTSFKNVFQSFNNNKFIWAMAQVIKAQIPIIDYQQLLNNEDLSAQIKSGFGSKGHGIIFVKNIIGYQQARREALPLINDIGNFPKQTINKYEKPSTFYSRGISIGREKFKGKHDHAKLSFYFNPITNDAYQIPKGHENEFSQFEKDLYSQSMNVWPTQQIPQLEGKFKTLSSIMIQTGILLARHIDKFAKKQIDTYSQGLLENTIKRGTFHFARMLHYFPEKKIQGQVDELCGWHNDHGALTALTSAMFIDQNGNVVDGPPSSGGLYAKNRNDKEVRVKIPANMLAFQLGESTQIYTGGKLEATPHAVKSPEDHASKQLSRNTFAIFLQADPLGKMTVPEGVEPDKASVIPSEKLSPLIDRWTKNGMYFKDFHANTLRYYYPE